MARSSPRRILLVEDESVFAAAVAVHLGRAGHACSISGSLRHARAYLAAHAQDPPEVVLLDLRLPDGDGAELLSAICRSEPHPAVVVMTAYGDIAQAVAAMKLGAVDYLQKPIDLDELLRVVQRAGLAPPLPRAGRVLAQAVPPGDGVELLGKSAALAAARRHIAGIAALGGARLPNVLILGETGTGKDVAARLIHRLGPRAARPFVHIDCASLPKDMIEAELFGHVRGAFTSAQASRAGLIEAAEDGTVFLDEIGEVPLALQAKLLNVLERRQVRRVGSSTEVPVAARFVAATNRNLYAMVAHGQFRDDLLFRLNPLTVQLPPLRECVGDAALLAAHFASAAARAHGRPVPVLTAEALAALTEYSWPGNARELKNVIERCVLLTTGPISAAALGLTPTSADRAVPRGHVPAPDGPITTLHDLERSAIETALTEARGNISKAARKLGLTRMAMRYRAEKYGLEASDYRARRR